MAGKTVTRAHLAQAINLEIGFSQQESARLVDAVLERVRDTLAEGEDVKISGFGTFSLHDKGERRGRNPKTNEEVPIKPRRVVSFRASRILKDQIANLKYVP